MFEISNILYVKSTSTALLLPLHLLRELHAWASGKNRSERVGKWEREFEKVSGWQWVNPNWELFRSCNLYENEGSKRSSESFSLV